MDTVIKKANILIEAIPYIHAFRQKVFVIKYGGSILDNDVIRKNILEDIVFLSYVGIRTVLVHGGGPHISTRLKESNIKSEFHDGMPDGISKDYYDAEGSRSEGLYVKGNREGIWRYYRKGVPEKVMLYKDGKYQESAEAQKV